MQWKLFDKILEEKCLFDQSKPVVIGVSGGPDSLCLLDLMRKTRIPIIVGHLNHGLRDVAAAEAEMVKKLCEDWQIPCYVKQVDVMEKAKTFHYSIEEAGRIVRYQYLFALAHEHGAQAVLVAHNSDDQVETILMHLIRGTGLSGLRGMEQRQLPNEWSDTIPLVRPLLDVSKQEVLSYCETNALSPSFDKTNQNMAYYRNRLRLELVPFLETYNPAIKKRLVCMADVLREEDEFLHQATQKNLENVLTAQGEGYFVINCSALVAAHPAVRRRALYTLMRKLKPETPNITFDVVESAVKFSEKTTASGKKMLAAGLEISNYLKDSILLADEQAVLNDLWPQIQFPVQVPLTPGTVIRLNSSWQLEIISNFSGAKSNPWQARLDISNKNELTLNSFIPGDRFTPFGMGGKSMKLGDYWTNEGLPARARMLWPLVRTNDEIMWIPGFTISDKYKITDETQHQISLILKKI